VYNVRCCTCTGTCIHSQSSWLLQRHLFGDSDGVISKLQSVLHAAARLVTVSDGTSISRRPIAVCSTGYQSSSGSHTRLQQCLWLVFVHGTCPAYLFICGLYASSDSCRMCQATLCAPRSPHCSDYENEDNWQSLLSLCCSYCLEQFTFYPSQHQHKSRTICKWI